MGKCKPFKVTVKGDISKVLSDVKKIAKKKGAIINGDTTKGTISIPSYKIKGTYSVKAKDITFAMEEDHWMITCSTVKSEMEKFFKGK